MKLYLKKLWKWYQKVDAQIQKNKIPLKKVNPECRCHQAENLRVKTLIGMFFIILLLSGNVFCAPVVFMHPVLCYGLFFMCVSFHILSLVIIHERKSSDNILPKATKKSE